MGPAGGRPPPAVVRTAPSPLAVPFDGEVGDRTGLFPIAYLARAAYFNLPHDSPEWIVATRTASQYVIPFTPHLPDGTFSRVTGWQGQVRGCRRAFCFVRRSSLHRRYLPTRRSLQGRSSCGATTASWASP